MKAQLTLKDGTVLNAKMEYNYFIASVAGNSVYIYPEHVSGAKFGVSLGYWENSEYVQSEVNEMPTSTNPPYVKTNVLKIGDSEYREVEVSLSVCSESGDWSTHYYSKFMTEKEFGAYMTKCAKEMAKELWQ